MRRSWRCGTQGPFVRLLYLPRLDEVVKDAVYGNTIFALPEGLIGWLVLWSVELPSPILIVGKASKVHSLIMFFSVIGGIQFFGLVGIVAGPLAVAVAVTRWKRTGVKRAERVRSRRKDLKRRINAALKAA